MESSPSSCLVKNGKRDNNALLHNVNKPVPTIKICDCFGIADITYLSYAIALTIFSRGSDFFLFGVLKSIYIRLV